MAIQDRLRRGIAGIITSPAVSNWLLTPTTLPRGSMLKGTLLRTPHDYGCLCSVAYLACEQTKARSFGSLPVSVYRRSNGRREVLDGHPVARLLSGMANDLMTGHDLRHWARLRVDTFGDAYIFVEWQRGEPVALFPITERVTLDYNKHAKAGQRLRYVVHGDTRADRTSAVTVPAGTYFADEVIHLKTAITQDGIHGVSLAEKAAQEVGLSIDLERFYAAMLTNGNHQLGHLEIPEKRLNDALIEDLRRAIDSKTGVNNAGKAPIFTAGAKWVTDQQTMKDASLIEQQAWVLQQVCRATNVPPQKVYDTTAATYSNAESARIDYATDTVAPDAASFEAAFMPVFESMGQPDVRLKFDLNGLMRGDSASRGQFYREMVYMGAMTRADVREKEDLNPIDGLEKPLIPLNYGVIEQDGSVSVYTSTPQEPADGNQEGTTD